LFHVPLYFSGIGPKGEVASLHQVISKRCFSVIAATVQKRPISYLELVTAERQENKISGFSTTYLVLIPDLPACCLL